MAAAATVVPGDDRVADETTYVPLLDMESWYMLEEKSITTTTFFRLDSMHSINRAVAAIRERLQAVVRSNPWMAGRIIRDKKRHKNVILAFPTVGTGEGVEQILDVIVDPTNALALVDDTCPLAEMMVTIARSPATLPIGRKLIGKPTAVAKFTVVIREAGSSGPTLMLVASMIHGVADGHTYYKLLSMLSHTVEIVPLSPERADYTEKVKEVLGAKEYKYMASPALAINVVGSMMFGRKSTPHAFLVDEEKVAEAKAAGSAELGRDGQFVSTNDVLTSTFGNASRARILMMAINWRGRIPGAKDTDAGNYEAVVCYDPDSYRTPACIRKSFTSAPGRVQRVPARRLPGFCENTYLRISSITTWVFPSFTGELQLLPDEATPVHMHLPIYLAEDAPMNFAVVFRIKKDTKAILYFLTDVTEEILRESGAPIGDALLPST